jgi:hypothetical protein
MMIIPRMPHTKAKESLLFKSCCYFQSFPSMLFLFDSLLQSLWDTAGQEEYDAIRCVASRFSLWLFPLCSTRPLSYDGTSVFLVTFSCASKVTLQNCAKKVFFTTLLFLYSIGFLLLFFCFLSALSGTLSLKLFSREKSRQ